MITSIKHKGLKRFYEQRDASRLDKRYLVKIEMLMTALDAITEEMDILALRKNVHKLRGNYGDYWSVTISGNLRLVFKFEVPDIYDVNLVDYH
jgi:proteic killer suppression protein